MKLEHRIFERKKIDFVFLFTSVRVNKKPAKSNIPRSNCMEFVQRYIYICSWRIKSKGQYQKYCMEEWPRSQISTTNQGPILTNVYVSLNKIQVIRPQGTTGRPLMNSSSWQEPVWLYPSPCKSCQSLLLLTYLHR